MNFRDQILFSALTAAVLALSATSSHAAGRASSCPDGTVCADSSSSSDASLSSSPACGDACSAPRMRTASSSVSKSLESSVDDAQALSKAAQSNDMDQVRALLIKHGFTEEQLSHHEIEVRSIVSPRDAASGLPTGKRQHKPLVVSSGDVDGDGAARKVSITITVSIKPPKIVITIRF